MVRLTEARNAFVETLFESIKNPLFSRSYYGFDKESNSVETAKSWYFAQWFDAEGMLINLFKSCTNADDEKNSTSYRLSVFAVDSIGDIDIQITEPEYKRLLTVLGGEDEQNKEHQGGE
jgi:hypothetical protein